MNYVEHLLNLISIVNGEVSISDFASLFGIPRGITSFATGLKVCVITARIKKQKSKILKRKRSMIT